MTITGETQSDYTATRNEDLRLESLKISKEINFNTCSSNVDAILKDALAIYNWIKTA